MSDSDYDQYGYDYDDAYEDEDEDEDEEEDIESMKVKDIYVMLAEKRVDDDVTRLGGTVLQRNGYNLTDKEATNAEPYDTMSSIRYCNAFLEVVERDMKDLEEDITKEMDVMKGYIQEKLNSYRENVSRSDYIAGSGNHTECFQDIAAMGRKTSQVKKAMENGMELGIELGIGQGLQDDVEDLEDNFKKEMDVNKAMQIGKELGIRQSLYDDKTQTLTELQVSTGRANENYTKKVVRLNDGRRRYILLPKKRMLAKKTS
jgi:hypothetical protein